MEERPSDFRDTLLELIDGSPDATDHPAPDQWLAYHRGELPPEEEDRLQEHLARCRDCFDLSAGAAAFTAPDETGDEVETAAAWRLLRPQLDAEPRNLREMTPGPRRGPAYGFRLLTSVAATFFVALVGMTGWDLRLQNTVATLQAAKANVSTAAFYGGERAAGGREQVIPLGPGLVQIYPGEDLPAYRLTIRDAATNQERVSEKLQHNQDHPLNLYLPEGLLPPGRYRLDLADSAGKTLETHFLRVAESGRGG